MKARVGRRLRRLKNGKILLMSSSIQSLMTILKAAVSFDGKVPTITVWAKSLNTMEEPLEVYGGLGKLVWLTQEVQDEVLNLPINLDLHWANDLKSYLFQTNLSDIWGKEKIRFQNVVRVANDTAVLLKHFLSEPTIEEAKLIRFQEEVQYLLDDVSSSDIDRELKGFLQSHLSEILNALKDFNIKGSKGIREAVQKTFAEASLNQTLREKLDSSLFGKRLWNVIAGLSTVISLITGAVALPDIIQKALPSITPELVEENPHHPDDKIDYQNPMPIYKKDEDDELEPPEKKSN
jgi:hypothetical protein